MKGICDIKITFFSRAASAVTKRWRSFSQTYEVENLWQSSSDTLGIFYIFYKWAGVLGGTTVIIIILNFTLISDDGTAL